MKNLLKVYAIVTKVLQQWKQKCHCGVLVNKIKRIQQNREFFYCKPLAINSICMEKSGMMRSEKENYDAFLEFCRQEKANVLAGSVAKALYRMAEYGYNKHKHGTEAKGVFYGTG